MSSDIDNKADDPEWWSAPYAAAPTPEDDLWFLPGPQEGSLTDMPWPVAARELKSDFEVWRAGEAAQYRGLLRATEALARFGERLARFPEQVGERFALSSVSAVLRSEGVWLGPERIALFRVLSSSTGDAARDLARASWAIRRLQGADRAGGPLDGVRGFLGRNAVALPLPATRFLLAEDRPLGGELEALGDRWIASVEGMKDLHPLTRGAFAFAQWRGQGLTPFEEILEPCVAAMRIGAANLAPFLPLAEGQNIGRLAVGGSIENRLVDFYTAVESGALRGLMELDRLAEWRIRAVEMTADLSGRTPPRLIAALLRLPVVSAELVAETFSCSRAGARRNLGLFAKRGLIRETTGQDRYRFWTVQL